VIVRDGGGAVIGRSVTRGATGLVAGRNDGTSGAGGIDEWRIVALGAWGGDESRSSRCAGTVACR
jgi:hypothetical protein